MSGCCMGWPANYCATHECPSNPKPRTLEAGIMTTTNETPAPPLATAGAELVSMVWAVAGFHGMPVRYCNTEEEAKTEAAKDIERRVVPPFATPPKAPIDAGAVEALALSASNEALRGALERALKERDSLEAVLRAKPTGTAAQRERQLEKKAAAAESEAIERCAKVAENMVDDNYRSVNLYGWPRATAIAIRALIQPDTGKEKAG